MISFKGLRGAFYNGDVTIGKGRQVSLVVGVRGRLRIRLIRISCLASRSALMPHSNTAEAAAEAAAARHLCVLP